VSGLLQAQLASASPRRARVALAGCGTVGGALIRLLRERRAAVEREQGVRFEMVGVLVRDLHRPRMVESAAGVVTNDLRAWLDQDADVVVEATGARDTALQIARATLVRGRRFITANKTLIAAHGPELAALARASGGRLHFEAAVGGGVPVIRVLREALRHTGVRSVRGVLNGTANYVLTRMAEGEPLAEALQHARLRGFAEADASRDLDGRDAADKIAILAWLAFGIDPAAVQVQRHLTSGGFDARRPEGVGLAHGRSFDLGAQADALIAAARVQGGVLRQIAECSLTEAGVIAAVEPVIVPATSPFAQAVGEENCVCIETRRNGTTRLFGPGAGGPPTAAALLSDLLAADSAEPGPRLSPPAPRPDERLHSWALCTGQGGVAPVFATLDAHGIAVQWVRTDSEARVHVLTSPAERGRITACLRVLEAAGTRPVAVRSEVG
jgi:homoserine dehydrogenase